jgi:hypothetical protein
MITAIPKSWFSWDFWLRDAGGNTVGEVRLSSWRERGSIVAGGVTYRIYRESFLGPFVMEAPDGSMAGRATKPSAFRREFVVSSDTCSYVLKTVSMFRREAGVFRGENRIGAITPVSWKGRRANARFTQAVPPELQAFLTWLTLLLWKRDSDAGAA